MSTRLGLALGALRASAPAAARTNPAAIRTVTIHFIALLMMGADRGTMPHIEQVGRLRCAPKPYPGAHADRRIGTPSLKPKHMRKRRPILGWRAQRPRQKLLVSPFLSVNPYPRMQDIPR